MNNGFHMEITKVAEGGRRGGQLGRETRSNDWTNPVETFQCLEKRMGAGSACFQTLETRRIVTYGIQSTESEKIAEQGVFEGETEPLGCGAVQNGARYAA